MTRAESAYKYNHSEKRYACMRRHRYNRSEKGRIVFARYNATEKGKLRRERYERSAKGRARTARYEKTKARKMLKDLYQINPARRMNVRLASQKRRNGIPALRCDDCQTMCKGSSTIPAPSRYASDWGTCPPEHLVVNGDWVDWPSMSVNYTQRAQKGQFALSFKKSVAKSRACLAEFVSRVQAPKASSR